MSLKKILIVYAILSIYQQLDISKIVIDFNQSITSGEVTYVFALSYAVKGNDNFIKSNADYMLSLPSSYDPKICFNLLNYKGQNLENNKIENLTDYLKDYDSIKIGCHQKWSIPLLFYVQFSKTNPRLNHQLGIRITYNNQNSLSVEGIQQFANFFDSIDNEGEVEIVSNDQSDVWTSQIVLNVKEDKINGIKEINLLNGEDGSTKKQTKAPTINWQFIIETDNILI